MKGQSKRSVFAALLGRHTPLKFQMPTALLTLWGNMLFKLHLQSGALAPMAASVVSLLAVNSAECQVMVCE